MRGHDAQGRIASPSRPNFDPTTMAESAFVNSYIRTIASQPVTYPDDYSQPPSNSLKRVPVLPVAVPPVPTRAEKPGESSSDIEITLKSVKPAKSIVLTVKGTDTIADVKSHWASEGGEVRLLLKGKALHDSKLVREYSVKDGDVITVMIKALPTPITTATDQTSKPHVPSLNIDTATPIKKHTRIPSVVLSPSPSVNEDGRITPEPSPKNLLLDLDGTSGLGRDVSAYHATMSKPELWERLLGFLRSVLSIH